MLHNIINFVAAAIALTSSLGFTRAEELCSISPGSYAAAKSSHPQVSAAIDTLNKYAIASWYTDRQSSSDLSAMISSMLTQCSEDTRLSIVVYGMPNKDCGAGYSSGGSVQSTSDYQAFLKGLTDAVGDRKVLYVVEPDALGLLTQDGGCGASAGYLDNLKIAVAALSANPNAELYLDVGYWMLADASNAGKVASAMKDISGAGAVKGVTINTSNYRSNDEVAGYCTTFQSAMGSTDMHCIVDTSRNFNGSPTSDWCNVPTAGIGKPPTSDTGFSNLDYFMWIKPPGESDGECNSGPAAGSFFLDGFKMLWDQGYFVKDLGMATVDASSSTTTAPSTTAPVVTETTAPSTTTPTATTAAPSKSSTSGSSGSNGAAGTVAPAWTDAPTSTTTTPSYTTSPSTYSPATTSPSTTSPATAYPSTTSPVQSAAPVTTAPAGKTDNTSQTSTTQTRSACKAKKRRLRTL